MRQSIASSVDIRMRNAFNNDCCHDFIDLELWQMNPTTRWYDASSNQNAELINSEIELHIEVVG